MAKEYGSVQERSINIKRQGIMNNNRDYYCNTIKSCKIFSDLSQDFVELLSSNASQIHFDEGKRVFSGSDEPTGNNDRLYLIDSGYVALGVEAPYDHEAPEGTGESENTKHLEFDWVGPGEIFGELDVLSDDRLLPRQVSATAMGPLSVIVINGASVRAIAPLLSSRLVALMMEKQRRLIAALQEVTFVGLVEIRLARSLLVQTRRFGRRHGAALFHPSGKLTQSRIANMVGADPRSILETLGTWGQSGIVHYYKGQLAIIDEHRLGAIAARQPGQRNSFMPGPLLREIDAALASGQNVYARQLALTALKRKALQQNALLQHRAILATARCGNIAEALRQLHHHGVDHRHQDTDLASLEPRLNKDLALSAINPELRNKYAITSALQYESIAQRSNDYYPGINAATMFLLAGQQDKAKAWAHSVLKRLQVAGDSYFEHSSRAEAQLIIGKMEAACTAYRSASRSSDANPGAIATSRRQIRIIGQALGLNVDEVMGQIPQRAVIHFTGHLATSEATETAVKTTKKRIAGCLASMDIGWAYGSLACGSDILFAESLYENGIELTAVLPFEVDYFIKESVQRGGEAWRSRFQQCLNQARKVIVLPWREMSPELAYAWADRVAMGLAVSQAKTLEAPAIQFAVCDEARSNEGAGTALAIAEWQRLGQASTRISCDWQSAATASTSIKNTCIPAMLLSMTSDNGVGVIKSDDSVLAVTDAVTMIEPFTGARAWLFENVSTAMNAARAIRRQVSWNPKAHRLLLDLVPYAPNKSPGDNLRNSWLVKSRPSTPVGNIAATEIFIAEALIANRAQWPSTYIGYVQCEGEIPPTPMHLLEENN